MGFNGIGSIHAKVTYPEFPAGTGACRVCVAYKATNKQDRYKQDSFYHSIFVLLYIQR
jgi:hypothetical protein